MKPEEFIEILKSGEVREISDLSYNLLHLTDMSTLKRLSKLVNEIETIVEGYNQFENEKVISLKRILSFLIPISNNGCRCEKYSICSYPSFSEQKKGLIRILAENHDIKTFQSNILCECVLCKRRFNVCEYEAGFGRRFDWKIII